MSASSKKKLRNQNTSAKMTEKQLAEQKEAKKLKLYTIGFAVVLAALIIVAAGIGIQRVFFGVGYNERKTVAVTVGDHDVSTAELSYFYIDAINNFYSQNSSFISFYGLETGKPLNEQIFDEANGKTWADYFLDNAKQSAQATYAVVDEASANGFTLSAEGSAQIDSTMSMLDLYAQVYGFTNADGYLRAMYGNGATKDSFREYAEKITTASEYNELYENSLSFTDEQVAEIEQQNPGKYDSYAYHQYYLAVSNFEGDDAAQQAENAAASVVGENIQSIADFDEAIAALPFNAGKESEASSASTANYLDATNGYLRDWLTDPATVVGSKTYVPVTSAYTEDADETAVVGYYVAYFDGRSDNQFPLANMRHILVSFEGGTEVDGVTTYSDEEKAAAREKAEALYNEWKAGDANEESFAAMATENTNDTSSAANGGLYENVYPNQMVAPINDWLFDASRFDGETAIIETTYGYHVVFFAGHSQQTYHNYLVNNDLTSEAVSAWYNGLLDATPVVDADLSKMRTDFVLGSAQ